MEKQSKIYIAGHLGLVGSAIWKILQNKGYTNLIGKSIQELDLMNRRRWLIFLPPKNLSMWYLLLLSRRYCCKQYLSGSVYIRKFDDSKHVIHNAYVHGVKKLLFLGSTCIYPKEAPQPMSEDFLLTSPLEYTNEPYAIAKIAGIKNVRELQFTIWHQLYFGNAYQLVWTQR
jgi:GDP-L-fucose synthase